MNKEEIIELLDKLDLDEWCTDLYKVPLTWCELYDIRNYITKLHQENKQLKEEIQDLKADYGNKAQVERDLLQERINKAIEYLKQREEDNMCCSVCSVMSDKLLEILKGD